MVKKFRDDLAVFCCPHVFRNERPILLVIRDPDGDWQFLCGKEDEDFDQCHHVDIGQFLERDASLKEMVKLEPSSGAERSEIDSDWKFFELED